MNRFLSFLLILLSPHLNAQEIAITFDDAPTGDGPLFRGEERSKRILAHLKNHQVDEAAFFILTGNINSSNQERLTQYANAGHLLANHTHSHGWIHQSGTNAYVQDVEIADRILREFPGFINWFRYPFLDEGRSKPVRDSLRTALQNLDLTNGYVTIDNYDWYLNHLVKQGKDLNRKINEDNLRKVYVDHIYNSIIFYDKVALRILGRSPKHVLLLHENDLAASFLGDLLNHLKTNGWKIISPREAYKDPIAHHIPDVLFNGQGRVAAIAREKGIPPKELVQLSEDEQYLDSLATQRKIFE